MRMREFIVLAVVLVVGAVTLMVVDLAMKRRHEPEPAIGTSKSMTLEIAEGVSFELLDGPTWYVHPKSVFPEKSQTLYFLRDIDMHLQVLADGCPDPAREAQNDLAGEKQDQFNKHGLTAADLADTRFGGAVGSKDQYPYAGYCLRDSRNDLIFAKLFLSIGPQCLALKTEEIAGSECPVSDATKFVDALRIRK